MLVSAESGGEERNNRRRFAWLYAGSLSSGWDGVGSQNYHKLFLKYFFLKSQSHPTPRPPISMTSLTTTNLTDAYRVRLDISMAKSRKVRGGNYVQLATVTNDGFPKCRTVVQRGLLRQGDHSVLKFITDKRSEKVQQIASNPKCELVWWFLKTSEQYRISGELTLVGNDSQNVELLQARKQQWGTLRDTAREQFYWEQPGVPLNESNEEEEEEEEETTTTSEGNEEEKTKTAAAEGGSGKMVIPTGGRGEDGKVLPPPDTFLLMLLWPKKVDYLRLSDNSRVVYQRTDAGDWTKEHMTP